MGIKRKIQVGFLALGLLLFLSGIISFFQLNRLSTSTHTMLGTSYRNMELSKTMLDAVQDQNTAFLQMIVTNRQMGDSLMQVGRHKFDSAVIAAQMAVRDLPGIDSICMADIIYKRSINTYLNDSVPGDRMIWYMDTYKTSYATLTSSIKSYMVSSQQMIDSKAHRLEDNAYRATTPGLIALMIAIIIVVIFFYFVNLYYIAPVIRITQALKGYLDSNIPFRVKIEGRDEVARLKEYVEKLIDLLKSKRNE